MTKNDKSGQITSTSSIPSSWEGRCSGNGHSDSPSSGPMSCAVCGKLPDSETGDDACMVSLGSVINACCGHGDREGYIMFEDNRIVHGLFTMSRVETPTEELTARENYRNRIVEIERKIKIYEKLLKKLNILHDSYDKGQYLFD